LRSCETGKKQAKNTQNEHFLKQMGIFHFKKKF
jgi:hypothetical protein